MPISPSFTSILYKEYEINFLQCYSNGFLKYTDLCNILQLTAASHSEIGGISFKEMQEHNQAWVLSRMRVEIIKLPKWRDKVVAKTWIKSLENSKSIRCLEIYLNEEKIVGCETFWAVFNTKTRKPENLALKHEHFEKFPTNNACLTPFSKIKIPQELELITSKKINLSDLDIVNHANSVKYLEWCLDYVNYKTILKQEIKSLEMNYLKEVSLYDEVKISSNKAIFTVSKDDKTCFALELELF